MYHLKTCWAKKKRNLMNSKRKHQWSIIASQDLFVLILLSTILSRNTMLFPHEKDTKWQRINEWKKNQSITNYWSICGNRAKKQSHRWRREVQTQKSVAAKTRNMASVLSQPTEKAAIHRCWCLEKGLLPHLGIREIWHIPAFPKRRIVFTQSIFSSFWCCSRWLPRT